MVNGQLSESVSLLIGGLVSLMVIGGIVLGFLIQIRKIRTDNKAERESEIKKASDEASKETAAAIAFRQLEKGLQEIKDMLCARPPCIQKQVVETLAEIKARQADDGKALFEVIASAKQAHKRLDEHRLVDHSLPSGRSHQEIKEV
jgi:hypothetical protein